MGSDRIIEMAFEFFEIGILRRLMQPSWVLRQSEGSPICNLFLNYKLSINDIVKTLDETYQHAVSVLIEQGITQERRSVLEKNVRKSNHRCSVRR